MWTSRSTFIALSVVAHGALAYGVGELNVKQSRVATAIEIAEAKKPAHRPPPAAKVEPPPRRPEPPPREKRASAPKRVEAEAPEQAAKAATPMQDLPDFGLSLSGGVDAAGIALPAAGSTPRAPRPLRPQASAKRLQPVAAAAGAADRCSDPPSKPKPRSVPQPTGTEAARAAGLEGKVRVQLTVDESGRVVDVKLVQGLGYGLDEAALAAARRAEFEPGSRCGQPTRATFNISMRFTL